MGSEIIFLKTQYTGSNSAHITPCKVPKSEAKEMISLSVFESVRAFLSNHPYVDTFHDIDNFGDDIRIRVLNEIRPYPDAHLFFKPKHLHWQRDWEKHLKKSVYSIKFSLAELENKEGLEGWEKCFVITEVNPRETTGFCGLISKEHVDSIIEKEPINRILKLSEMPEIFRSEFKNERFYTGFEEVMGQKNGFYALGNLVVFDWQNTYNELKSKCIDTKIIPKEFRCENFDLSKDPGTAYSNSGKGKNDITNTLNKIVLVVIALLILYLIFS